MQSGKKRGGTGKKGAAHYEKRMSYQQNQKNRRANRKKRRTFFSLVFASAAVITILFMTPLFNIRTVNVSGNNTVSDESIDEIMSPLVGQNLFISGSEKISGMIKELPYIDEVYVRKSLIPPSVTLDVTEYSEAAAIRTEGKNLIVSSGLHVLGEETGDITGIPRVTGVGVGSYSLGGAAELDDEEKRQTLEDMLMTLEGAGILDRVIEIDINSLMYIVLNFDERLEIRCGSQLDIEHKLLLLREVIMSGAIESNSRGIIDLSEPGKAVYTP